MPRLAHLCYTPNTLRQFRRKAKYPKGNLKEKEENDKKLKFNPQTQ